MYSITEYRFAGKSPEPTILNKGTNREEEAMVWEGGIVSARRLLGEDYETEDEAIVRSAELYEQSQANEGHCDYDYSMRPQKNTDLINALNQAYANVVESRTGVRVQNIDGVYEYDNFISITYRTEEGDELIYTWYDSMQNLLLEMCGL